MQKIPLLFRKDYENTQIYDKINPGSEWVLLEEGEATVKYDGTCTQIKHGVFYKRYDRKLNKQACRLRKQGYQGPWLLEDFKKAPDGWESCEESPNFHTGHWPGWLPVGNGPEDQYHREALNGQSDGKYELVGPKVQRNRYNLQDHQLWRHGSEEIEVRRDFDSIREWLKNHQVEGIVFHHPDGRKAKIRRKDFGFAW